MNKNMVAATIAYNWKWIHAKRTKKEIEATEHRKYLAHALSEWRARNRKAI